MVFYAVIQSIDIIQFGKSHNGRSNRTFNKSEFLQSCCFDKILFRNEAHVWLLRNDLYCVF